MKKEAFTEFQLPPELKEHGVSRIAKEGSTILIQMMNGGGSSRQLTPIRFDIEPSWQKTAANFEKQSKGLVADQELKQALIFYLSEQWLNLLDGEGSSSSHTTSTTTATGDEVEGGTGGEGGVASSDGNGGGATSGIGNTNSADRIGSDNDSPPTAAQRALELVEERCSDLFVDQYGSPYAAVRINGHSETLALKSSRFKSWLCGTYYESENAAILNSENLTNALNILKARAELGGIRKDLHLRVAGAPNKEVEPYTIYYDLGNKYWQAIKITAAAEKENGWSIIEQAPIIFRRYGNSQQSQVYPSKQYPPDIFDRFMKLINVKDKQDNKLLLKCYIITMFYPEIPHPALMLHGEQGSAKSTAEELIKMLVDPSPLKTVSFTRDISQLVQKLMHNYVCYFDNISRIPEEISDELCRAVTGSGFSKRELYSDDDDIIYNFKRCIGLSGVNLAATRPDLLDRGIIGEFELIPKENKRKIEEIWQEFELIKSELLGYILDILAKVLQVKKNGGIKLEGYPRMADFADIGEIASRCMGYEDNRFLNAYYKNIDLQAEESIEANPVGKAIVRLMEDRNEEQEPWKGTASELLEELEPIAEQLKINTKTSKLWPKAPNSLSRRITEVKTNLRQIGIAIDRYVIDQRRNVKGIKIRKISPVSQDGQIQENLAQVASDTSGDTSNSTGDISPEPQKISPDKTPKNHAQNGSYGDSGDTCDIIRPSMKERLSNDDDGGDGDGLLLNTTATITTKNTITNFQPIVSVEDFFHDEPSLPWKALPSHTLEQSPCYPIIGKKGKFYHCKLHPNEVRNVHLDTIEQHCKYNDPELHKAEILRLQLLLASPEESMTRVIRIITKTDEEEAAAAVVRNNIFYAAFQVSLNQRRQQAIRPPFVNFDIKPEHHAMQVAAAITNNINYSQAILLKKNTAEQQQHKFDASLYPDIKPTKPPVDYEPYECLICHNGKAYYFEKNKDAMHISFFYVHYDEPPIGVEVNEKGEAVSFKYRTCGPKTGYFSTSEALEAAYDDIMKHEREKEKNKAKEKRHVGRPPV